MKMRVKVNETITVQFEGADGEAAAAAVQSFLAEIL
jgi:phosphotransferase system HPr-like phosphotransfer protein